MTPTGNGARESRQISMAPFQAGTGPRSAMIGKGIGRRWVVVLPDLLAEIERQGGYESGVGPEPVVSLELFFEGNDDPGSIGCNLIDHPGTQRFFTILHEVRERPDVLDIRVGIGEVLADDEWPFSDHVYVVTSASADQVLRQTALLGAEPKVKSAWWNDAPPATPIPIPEGMRLLTLWWD